MAAELGTGKQSCEQRVDKQYHKREGKMCRHPTTQPQHKLPSDHEKSR